MEEPPAKKARVHFGDSEEAEKKPVVAPQASSDAQENGAISGVSAAVLAGIKAGNINIDDGEHLIEFKTLQRTLCSTNL